MGRLLAVPVLLVGLTACGGGDSDDSGPGGDSRGPTEKLSRADRFAAELESLPGVVTAEAVEQARGRRGRITQLEVDLVVADEATPPEVAAALDAVAAHDRRLGFKKHHLLIVEREGDDRHPLQYSDRPRVVAIDLAQQWELVEEQLDPALPWFLDGYGVVTVELAGTAGPDEVTATAEEVRSDSDLAAVSRWSIVGENAEGRFTFATEGGMTEALLESWRQAVANLDLGPAGASLTFAPLSPPPSMYVDMEWELPGIRGPNQLTPRRWGDRLWPVLRAQLDVLRGLPSSSYFSARNYYPESNGSGRGHDPFLIAVAGQPGSTEEPDRGWSVAADRYLKGG